MRRSCSGEHERRDLEEDLREPDPPGVRILAHHQPVAAVAPPHRPRRSTRRTRTRPPSAPRRLRSSSSLSPIWPNSQVSNVMSSSRLGQRHRALIALDLGDRRHGLALGIDQLLDDELGLAARHLGAEPVRTLAQTGSCCARSVLSPAPRPRRVAWRSPDCLPGSDTTGMVYACQPRAMGRAESIFERVRCALRGTDRRRGSRPAATARRCTRSRSPPWCCSSSTTWLLKPRLGPSAITGKLSDVAGLVFSAGSPCCPLRSASRCAWPPRSARLDPSLSRRRPHPVHRRHRRGVRHAVQLDPAAAHLLAGGLSRLGRHAPRSRPTRATCSACPPWRSLALDRPRRRLRRVPLGRPAAIHRLGRPALAALADVRWAGAPAKRIAALAAAIDRWDTPEVDKLLTHTKT